MMPVGVPAIAVLDVTVSLAVLMVLRYPEEEALVTYSVEPAELRALKVAPLGTGIVVVTVLVAVLTTETVASPELST
jgi:hypothetical protein